MTRKEIVDTLLQIDRRKPKQARELTEEERVAISEAARSGDRELASMASGITFEVLKNYIKGRINAIGKSLEMEDELQNAFIALHTQLYLYDPKYSLITFFTPILVNSLLFENHKHLTREEKAMDQYISAVIFDMKKNGIKELTPKSIVSYIKENLDPDSEITQEDVLQYKENKDRLKHGDKMSKHERLVKRNVERAIMSLSGEGNFDPSIRELKEYIQLHYNKSYAEVAIINSFRNNRIQNSLSMFTDIADPLHDNPEKTYIEKERIERLNNMIDLLDPAQKKIIEIKLGLYDKPENANNSDVSVKEIHKIYREEEDPTATLLQVKRTLYEAERTLAAMMQEGPVNDAREGIVYEFVDDEKDFYVNDADEVEYEDIFDDII